MLADDEVVVVEVVESLEAEVVAALGLVPRCTPSWFVIEVTRFLMSSGGGPPPPPPTVPSAETESMVIP